MVIKKTFKKMAAGLLMATMMTGSLAACSEKDNISTGSVDSKYEITDNSEVAFDLGKSTITYGELLYFIAYYEMMGEYQRAYYADAMGYTGNFWDEVDENGNSEAQNYKNNAFQEANYVEVMKNAAIDAGITLTEDELAEIEQSSKDSVALYTDEQLKKSGITFEGFYSAQKTIAYTNKYVELLKKDFKESDVYKQAIEAVKLEDNLAYDVNYAFLSLMSTNAEGVAIANDEALMKNYREIMKDIQSKVKGGVEFIEVQKEYADKAELVFGSKVVGKNDESVDTEILDKLKELKIDDVSEVIETDYGIFVFQMLNDKCEDNYQQTLQEESDKILESMVTAKFNELNEEYSAVGNEELLAKIEMGHVTMSDK